MSVNTPSDSYEHYMSQWTRCRDAYNGSDAIKAKRDQYLPPIDMHKNQEAKYAAYLKRAYFYPAMTRTVLGLAGAVFQKPPTVVWPTPETEARKDDITGSGEGFELFAYETLKEDLITGGYGILVDIPAEESAVEYPFMVRYRREDAIAIKRERRGGDEIIVRVVLAETESEEKGFETKRKPRYRVLELGRSIRDEKGNTEDFANGNGEPIYVSTIWRQDKNDENKFIPDDPLFPSRGGENLTFIPFVAPDDKSPPLRDMVDVNLSHYRNSADYEHGLHYCGIPVPWASKEVQADGKVGIGPSHLLVVPDGTFQIAQADGDMMGALQLQMERKEKAMAALGARLLEEQPRSAETATAVRMRHSGEHASLRTEAGCVEADLAMALRFFGWWTTRKDLDQVEASVELNKDFLPEPMDPQMLQQLLMAVLSDKISYATFWYLLSQGELARPGISFEEELAEISRQSTLPSLVADKGTGEGQPEE